MTTNLDQFHNLGREQVETVSSAAASFAKAFQTMAAEAAEFSKNTMEMNTAHIEKLLGGAHSIESAIQIQSDYAKASYEGFMAQAAKVRDLYANLVKETLRPLEVAANKFQATVNSDKQAS